MTILCITKIKQLTEYVSFELGMVVYVDDRVEGRREFCEHRTEGLCYRRDALHEK